MARSLVLLMVSAGPVLAQTSATTQPPKPAQAAPAEMTLEGCLRSSAAGDAKTAPQPVVYTLDVGAGQDATATAPSKPSARPPDAKPGAAPKPATYTIAAPATVGLATHVNHRVKLTGHLRDANANTTGTGGRRSPEAVEAIDPAAAASARTFEVRALQMVSATCPSR